MEKFEQEEARWPAPHSSRFETLSELYKANDQLKKDIENVENYTAELHTEMLMMAAAQEDKESKKKKDSVSEG